MSSRRSSDGVEEPLTSSSNRGPYSHSDHLNIFVTSAEEIRDQPLPSPPYRRVATASQVELGSFQSPPYTSQSRLSLSEMEDDIRDEKIDETTTTTKAVHYPDNLGRRPPGLGSLPRFESQTPSGPPSLAGTDDEEDSDYDWSGEEDLVEEEEKFEKKMGVKQKRQGCGFKRYVGYVQCIVAISCRS